MSFKLAPSLTLPEGASTDTFAFFGTRGSGKTYGAGRTIEAFHDGGVQVVIVDPVGVWYGLRLAADGRGRGLDIPVFGGLHGDVPLEPTGGELVARLIVERGISVVLDVSTFTLGQQHKFVLAFAMALFNLKKASRSPIHVVFDEAHEFVPQNPGPAEAEMLGAVRRLWKMGRNFGIGVSLISPRPAEVNKGCVDITERMFCGRLKGPRDRKAMEGWAASQDADMSALDKLPQLAAGELLFWGDKGPMGVRFFPKRTFDSSKTPEAGDARPAATLPKIDLEEVRAAMAATIEEAKANDPKALRAEIATLTRELGDLRESSAPSASSREVEGLRSDLADARERLGEAFATGASEARAEIGATAEEVRALRAFVDHVTDFSRGIPSRLSALNTASAVSAIGATRTIITARPLEVRTIRPDRLTPPRESDRKMAGEARRCLAALAQHGTMGPKRLALLCGYAPGGSSFRKGIGQARTMGWVQDTGGNIVVTTAGRGALGDFERLPTGRALLDYWLANPALPGESKRIMKLLIAHTHRPWSSKDLEDATGYVAGGSSMRKGVGRLRSLELVEDLDGGITLAADLLERRAS